MENDSSAFEILQKLNVKKQRYTYYLDVFDI